MVGGVVLDNSVLIPLVAPDEDAAYSERVFGSLSEGMRLIAPAICMFEFGNTVLTCVRRLRMTMSEAWEAFERLEQLPIEFGEGLSFAETTAIHGLSLRSGLSFYDGAYLMLAMTRGARLATLDEKLRKAAVAQGVEIVQ